MESCLRSGDWQKVMFIGRKYFENIKVGDNKPGHNNFKNKLSAAFVEFGHSAEGIKELLDAIWHFFNFVSKYVHDKDRLGNLTTLPTPTRADAFFAYALAIGLLNMIGEKIR